MAAPLDRPQVDAGSGRAAGEGLLDRLLAGDPSFDVEPAVGGRPRPVQPFCFAQSSTVSTAPGYEAPLGIEPPSYLTVSSLRPWTWSTDTGKDGLQWLWSFHCMPASVTMAATRLDRSQA